MVTGPYTYELYAHPADSEIAAAMGRSIVAARIQPPARIPDALLRQYTSGQIEVIEYAQTRSASVYNVYVNADANSHSERVAAAASVVAGIVDVLNAVETNDLAVWGPHFEQVDIEQSKVGTN